MRRYLGVSAKEYLTKMPGWETEVLLKGLHEEILAKQQQK